MGGQAGGGIGAGVAVELVAGAQHVLEVVDADFVGVGGGAVLFGEAPEGADVKRHALVSPQAQFLGKVLAGGVVEFGGDWGPR